MDKIKTLDAQKVFEHAIKVGFLVEKEDAENSVYDYMYMYSENGSDYFKHSLTREYKVNRNGLKVEDGK